MTITFGSKEAQEILEDDRARGYTSITPDVEMVDCPDCEGDGYTDEECSECGHIYEADCNTCDSEGRITSEIFLKLDAERDGNNARAERAKLNNWNAGKAIMD